MNWWFDPRNLYGLLMGTTTDFLKPSRRPHWPTHLHSIDENLKVFLGGTGNCGVLFSDDKCLLINCNSGASSARLAQLVAEKKSLTLVGTSGLADYIGGANQFQWQEIFLPAGFKAKKESFSFNLIEETTEIPWGDEQVVFIPVKQTFSKSDLIVYLKNRQILFMGGLFYNNIHPIFDRHRGVNFSQWKSYLENICKKYPSQTIVPHEGDLCGPSELNSFSQYLGALSDPSTEFSFCRQNFDWREIPGYTSLEENFDFVRQQIQK